MAKIPASSSAFTIPEAIPESNITQHESTQLYTSPSQQQQQQQPFQQQLTASNVQHRSIHHPQQHYHHESLDFTKLLGFVTDSNQTTPIESTNDGTGFTGGPFNSSDYLLQQQTDGGIFQGMFNIPNYQLNLDETGNVYSYDGLGINPENSNNDTTMHDF
ncbi:unnamed protein product [Ambrosiozyma monospora]|uniref:Unnamed protein product n=1 Tax=Ambrosiozyma monospora TaxID=43982 RepID=A0ACB5T9K6_AMBMO|nr:unnamed protein product [Ambrosiozyma monospora]